MKKAKGHQEDRRKFLVGMGVAGAAATATLASPALAAASKCGGTRWDQEHELIIIGSGFAGLAAAIQAKKLGAKDVVIYEKMPVYGGNSAFNGGLFAVPASPLL